ncbi:MAG TPA: hypothetical protein VFA12_09570 [Stellaceae bacterium]|nr:hypothetical protein [Stellaceae bacterium]
MMETSSITSSVLVAAASPIASLLVVHLVKNWLAHRAHRVVQIKLESGDRVRLEVDPNESEAAIGEYVRHYSGAALKKQSMAAGR